MKSILSTLCLLFSALPLLAAEPAVAFQKDAGKLDITIDGQPFATYLHAHDQIPRPFFRHVRTPGGAQATRNQPPTGKDLIDHATFHPGVWLAFGDLSGADSWRVKAAVKHEKYLEEPKGGDGAGSFTVVNHYLNNDGKLLCRETCRYTVAVRPAGYLLFAQSEFTGDADFAFGDQEEMGFGVRLATPLIVQKGGKITNSAGHVNEKQAWGKAADWCDYSGTIDGHRVGVLLMPDPANFRKSWFHVRDYGLAVANPFGQASFGAGGRSKVVVKPGEKFRVGFAVLFYRVAGDKPLDAAAAYQDFVKLAEGK